MVPGKHEPAAAPSRRDTARGHPRALPALAGGLAFAALLALAGPAQASLGPAEPHSPNASDLSTAWYVMLAVIVVLAVAINAALIGAIARFRGIRGRTPARLEARRGLLARVGGAIGVLVTAILIFALVITFSSRSIEPSGPEGLAASSSRTAQVGVTDPPSGSDAALEIDVVGQQWLWRFQYPALEQGAAAATDTSFSTLFSYGELTVPVDTAVILNITSTDVLHNWWVPALGGQVQAVPGQTSQTWFKADEIGRFTGRSTSFSGSAYPAMRSWVNVVSASDYEAHVADLAAEIEEAQTSVAQQQQVTDTPQEEATP